MIRYYVYSVHDGKTIEYVEIHTDRLDGRLWETIRHQIRAWTHRLNDDICIWVKRDRQPLVTLRTIYNPEVGYKVLAITRETNGKTIVL